MRPPWFFCNGWWSPWCLFDVAAHRLLGWDNEGDHWLCRRHDQAIHTRLANETQEEVTEEK